MALGFTQLLTEMSKIKSKFAAVTGRGGLLGCEMVRIPHCIYNSLTHGGKVVNPKESAALTGMSTIKYFWA
jgi:hypothetical protein